MLVAILGFVLPEFDYTWLVDSTKESLPQARCQLPRCRECRYVCRHPTNSTHTSHPRILEPTGAFLL